jgi:hypothetical protein
MVSTSEGEGTMTSTWFRTAWQLGTGLAFIGATAACEQGTHLLAPTATGPTHVADLSQRPSPATATALTVDGTWHYHEDSFLVFPGDLAGALGLEWEGPVLHLRCTSPDGVLTLSQSGSAFTGSLVHPTGTCRTAGGQQTAPPWALPFHATIAGAVTGKALHFDQTDDPPDPMGPVICSKHGTIQVDAGVAVELETTGRCDLSAFPFRPATATNTGTATPTAP